MAVRPRRLYCIRWPWRFHIFQAGCLSSCCLTDNLKTRECFLGTLIAWMERQSFPCPTVLLSEDRASIRNTEFNVLQVMSSVHRPYIYDHTTTVSLRLQLQINQYLQIFLRSDYLQLDRASQSVKYLWSEFRRSEVQILAVHRLS